MTTHPKSKSKPEPGWLKKIVESAEREVAEWPAWMRGDQQNQTGSEVGDE